MKKRTKILTVAQLALLMSLTACSNEKPAPENWDVEKEMKKEENQQVSSSTSNHLLLYWLLFSRNSGHQGMVNSNFSNRVHDKDRSRSGAYAGGFIATNPGVRRGFTSGTGSKFSTSGKSISRGGFGASGRGFSAHS